VAQAASSRTLNQNADAPHRLLRRVGYLREQDLSDELTEIPPPDRPSAGHPRASFARSTPRFAALAGEGEEGAAIADLSGLDIFGDDVRQREGTATRGGRYECDICCHLFASGDLAMKALIFAVTVAAIALFASAAEAKGCLKGAVVGGVAGHYAGHHGWLGAAAGCLYGRHHANQQERQQDQRTQGQSSGQGKL
jgi:hypothetical protein